MQEDTTFEESLIEIKRNGNVNLSDIQEEFNKRYNFYELKEKS